MVSTAMAADVAAQEIQSVQPKKFTLDVNRIESETKPVVVADPEMHERANGLIESLLAMDLDADQEAIKTEVSRAGSNLLRGGGRKSELLSAKMKELMQDKTGGENVANDLIALRDEVSKLDPGRVNFSPGGIGRFVEKMPIIGGRVKKYLNQYERGDVVINQIADGLRAGQARLENDNVILRDDQAEWRMASIALKKEAEFLKLVSDQLQSRIATMENQEHKGFLQREVVFPLMKTHSRLLTAAAVDQQGVLSAEVLVRANTALIEGIEDALYVTIRALRIGVTLAVALAHQKKVLGGLEKTQDMTNKMLERNADMLGTQAADVYKRASGVGVNVDTLQAAMDKSIAAIKSLDDFRMEAIRTMSGQIKQLEQVTDNGEKAIREMEAGNKIADDVSTAGFFAYAQKAA